MASEERDFSQNMGMFEAAVHAKPVTLESQDLSVILLALDGSNQDDTARALAQRLAKTTQAQVQEFAGATTCADIIHAIKGQKAQLLVLPAPFGRDIEALKDESLGSVVDMTLHEAPCPVLCVRNPMEEEQLAKVFTDILVPITEHVGDHQRALSWAFRLMESDGELELLGVADRNLLTEAKALLGDAISDEALQSEALNRAVTADIGGLVAAVQKKGAEQGIGVRVEVREGEPVAVTLQEANNRPRLIVIAGSHDHTSSAYHHAADLTLGANGPVLVV